MNQKTLELLAPAANAEVAIQAVVHGADAVYIGATSHGARKGASNSLSDIERVVEFAHQYRAKVYVTVNTIVYEHELKQVETLCSDLYRIGVDALIVQDMAILDLDIPPIPLHASTQCDIRSPEKAKFLQDVGFSQLVLARELTLDEIRGIADCVDVQVECFVHGALCVCYSGRCHASCVSFQRSANRGECAQICRLPFSLVDAGGRILSQGRHLLSLHDLNASQKFEDLINAGVTSFKIEGRLKDVGYVKNIVAYYSQLINGIISRRPDEFRRSSYGISEIRFTPDPVKSFNRGFTDYFLSSRRPASIASILTPKSMGEVIADRSFLHNGDGISYFDSKGQYQGANVNKVSGKRIITNRNAEIPDGVEIHRTSDIEWQKKMSRPTAERKLSLSMTMDDTGISATDERGMTVRVPLDVTKDRARRIMDYQGELAKLGNTPYCLTDFNCKHDPYLFIPRSSISGLRRKIVECLNTANAATYCFERRRPERGTPTYPSRKLDYKDNVANSVAEKFYRRHGVTEIEWALETKTTTPKPGTVVMTTRHCILRELGLCKKENAERVNEPLKLLSGSNIRYSLRFNCSLCEMEVALDS